MITVRGARRSVRFIARRVTMRHPENKALLNLEIDHILIRGKGRISCVSESSLRRSEKILC